MMRLMIAALFMLFTPILYAANTVDVVEIANFYCQECYKADQYTNRIEEAVKSKGGRYDFVPVFLNYANAWSSRVYFSMPDEFKEKTRQAFFTAINVSGITMKTPESACVVIHDALSNYSVNECINRATSTIPNEHLANALTLLHHIYNKQDDVLLFPVFVIEKDNEIKATFSRREYEDVEVLVNEVVRYVTSL